MLKIKDKSSLIDFVVYILIAVFTYIIILGFDFSRSNSTVIVLFLLIGIVSFINIIRCTANCNIYRMVYMFSYIFFFIAPLQQYTSKIVFWRGNGFSINYNDSDYIKANIMIILFLLIYEIGYNVYKSINKNKTNIIKKRQTEVNLTNNSIYILVISSTLSFMILLFTGNISKTTVFIPNYNLFNQVVNILRYMPLCALVIYLTYFKEAKGRKKNFLLGVIVLENIIIYFPTWGHLSRFMLFGAYLVVYATLYSNSKRKSVFFLIWVLAMCYMFSLTKNMTSINHLFAAEVNFNHVDFDAYQVLMATIKYVDKEGIVWGRNLVSAIAFLIPRDIWNGKLESTGAIIAEYYNSWFENISSPIVGEMYFAFSIFGVIVISFLCGVVSCIVDGWKEETDFTKKGIFLVVTGMTIYIMRGALLATVAFTGGFIIAMLAMGFVCRDKKEIIKYE